MPQTPRPRTLALVDAENLLGADRTRADDTAPGLSDDIRACAQLSDVDHTIVAAGPTVALPVFTNFPSAQRVIGRGLDGADLALIDAINIPDVAHRYDRVVIASGDGIFTATASALRAAGLQVDILSRLDSLSTRLAAAASNVIPFRRDFALAA